MSLINSTAIPNGAKAYEIEQSLRHNDDNDAKLSFTPATNGTSTDVFTVSFWFKRGKLGHAQYLFDISETTISFGDNDKLVGNLRGTTSGNYFWYTNAKFRDTSAWYHIVAAWDSTQSTDTNRFKLYVNGVIQTFSSISYMPQNREMKNNSVHYIGYEGSGYASDGYFAEVNFIDGQTKAPTDFGETGDYGEWKPIEYKGTYGTNGFYLPFKQDYTVEGFSTVTYSGNGSNRYLGGFGFQPDLIWQKTRNYGYGHQIVDSVRGTSKEFYEITSDSSGAEANSTTGLTGFKPDGVTIGTGNGWNSNNRTQVIWAWDMGTTTNPKHQISAVGNVKHSTTQNKIGATSIAFDGTGDRLDIPASDLMESAEGTIECWVYMNALADGSQVYYNPPIYNKGNVYQALTVRANGKVTSHLYTGAVNELISTNAISTGSWNHIALTWNSAGRKIWINGVLNGSSNISLTSMATGGQNATFHIGEGVNSSSVSLNAYVDELRVSKIVRYTGNFTPYESARGEDNDTQFLLHSNADNNSTSFVDSSDGGDVNADGSIESIVAANPTYGQSIVSYTGASGAKTIGHGLSSTPEMIIVKDRSSAQEWLVYHHSLTDAKDKYLRLDTTSAVADNTFWNDTAPTNQVFSVGDSRPVNSGHGDSYIAYCFHSVSGYSKFGTYTGDATTNNSKSVTLGFQPAFLMVKKTSGTGNWVMVDNTRNPNVDDIDLYLKADTNDVEATQSGNLFKFTSTGFTIGANLGDVNANGATYIYMAFADKREYAYWLDQSGNNNDWTSNNLTESDISVDSPTNNFSTFNPLDPQGTTSITFSEGNLKVVQAASWTGAVNNVLMTSGKWYWEVCGIDMSNLGVGVIKPNGAQHLAMNVANNGYFGKADRGYGINFQHGNDIDFFTNTSETTQQMFSSYSNGDIAQVAYDADTGKIWIAKNNIWGTTSGGVGNPATGANPAATVANPEEGYLAGFALENCTLVANFGQDSSFAGNKTAQGNQDGNDIGDFYYTPPSGFLALCTKNLPEPAVIPSEHFNTVLWTASGSANQAITGVGFQPDFNWIKDRTGGNSHHLFDAVRGAGKRLMSNAADVESTVNSHTAFNTDGFTLGAVGTGISVSGNSHVAWNWKANGAGASNTDGSINTTKTSANVDAGFSIMTYTGTNSTRTIGHGLSKPPEFWVTKPRTDVSDNQWFACHKGFATDYYTDFIHFDTSGAKQDSSARWGDTAPTDSVITIGPASTNVASGDYVCYAWHSVEGYSKVGSYEGNNSADGTFVYTGFRPAFIIVKNSDTGNNWIMSDTKREPTNVMADELYPDLSNAEYISSGERWDFLSNGFKLRSGSAVTNEDTHIYIAFAETPFKYSNAR